MVLVRKKEIYVHALSRAPEKTAIRGRRRGSASAAKPTSPFKDLTALGKYPGSAGGRSFARREC